MFKGYLRLKLTSCSMALFLFCCAAFSAQTQAQITIDSRSAGGEFSNTGVVSLSWTHTIGNGSNRAIFVGVETTSAAGIGAVCSGIQGGCVSLPGAVNPVTSVTYNGDAMNLVISAGGADRQVSIYQLVGPPTGAGTINVSFTPGAVTHAVGTSVSFFGVNQATPAVNPNTNSNAVGAPTNSPNVTVSGSGVTTNDLVIDALASTPGAVFFLEGAGQTVCADTSDENTCTRGRRFFFNAYDVGASSAKQANSAGTTMSWTMTTAQPWVIAATVVKAAPPVTAAAVSVSGRVLSNRGRGVARARIKSSNVLTSETQYAVTNQFGYYRFNDISVGATYIVEVLHKQFRFAPQVITVTEEVENLNFSLRF